MKLVRDLMIPLADIPLVREDSTIRDAMIALNKVRHLQPEGRAPLGTVFVVDDKSQITGKLGPFACIKALGGAFQAVEASRDLSRVGISTNSIATIRDHYRFLQEAISDMCGRASSILAKDAMHPIFESIHADASLQEAVLKMGAWNTLSVPVVKGNEVVGMLRLLDLFREVSDVVVSHPEECE